MYEDALSYSLGSLQVFHYGLCIAAGAALAIILSYLMARRRGISGDTILLWAVISLPLSLVVSRLLFCALDFRFHSVFSLRALLSFWGGGFSMVGALLGAALSAVFAARAHRLCPLKLLDCLMPGLFVFICLARMGEGATELLGRSRPLAGEALRPSFLFSTDGYDFFLNTYLLEAATALVLCGVSLLAGYKEQRSGDVTLLSMLLLGCTQMVWESLRFDAHMRQSFISMQQLLYAVMFAVPLFVFAARYGKKAGRKRPLVLSTALLALVAIALIALEFMIDRSRISRILLYALYALLSSLPAIFTLIFKKRSHLA